VITPNGDGLVYFFYVLVHSLYSELILIVLYTCRSWLEPNFPGVGHLRQVNKILGNICRMLWPGMVELVSGEWIPATSWNHYRYGVNIMFGNTQKAVCAEFWV
jgi:hypothetical protein